MSSFLPPPAESGMPFQSDAATALLDERRTCSRADQRWDVTLVRDDGAAIGPYKSDNISESGLHVTVPVGYGLAVGQRYEVLIRESASSGGNCGFDDGIYATVVRTQVKAGGDQHCVGVGLRLDQPLFF
ncbi:MAG: hypothetical protein FLDDKLPJ_01852 [Phycisphaerae bacterium]|nr:hypothetical protein [Phycisphaerae bacterium]